MGSVSTTVTANWTVVADASGFATVVSGDDVETFVASSPPFEGEAWSDVDLMSAVPSGATITDMTFDLTLEVDGSRQSPSIAVAPRLQFIDKAEYLGGTFLLGYGVFGAGGVGNLPDDNDPHAITYVNTTYAAVSGGAGIDDLDAFAAALANPSTPVILQVRAPQNATPGTGIWYRAVFTLTFLYDEFLPCDTWVDLDLSTATFTNPTGTAPQGQYVDGVITGLDGHNAQFWFPFELDPLKGYRVEVTFDPGSPWDGDGDPVSSDRFILLFDTTPGDEGVTGGTLADGFSNTADVCTLTIGPGLSDWDDPDVGVAEGLTRLLFQTSASGAVSAIRIRKLCTTFAPPLRQYPRSDALGASTVRRLYPPPPTIQASNRRGPSAIL